ncbi:MAG TPA: ABC transporter permease [Sphingomicrobium sp.]|jgi:ABC-2 type transport system permease protein|nr:ABC transporter permease [Sphingomicrobium sp.]
MNRILRSSWVIARRDFTATVLSKAFIFFLIGPLFPVLLGGMFGGIGARVATQTDHHRVAVIGPRAEFVRLISARDKLAGALGERDVVDLVTFAPRADVELQQRDLLRSKTPTFVAVLTGGLKQPHLSGAIEPDGTTAGQMRLILNLARAPEGRAPQLVVTHTERSTGSVTRSRAITAQAGQMLLFFLTIILAGMTLSQLIEEKSNKVIEVLAAAVPIESIFLGKLFAMLATSVVGIAVWASAAAVIVAMLTAGGGVGLPPPAVGTTPFVVLAMIYFAMNYLLLGSVFLSIGAQATTAREVQTMSMPVTFGQVLIFGFASLAVGTVNSPIAIVGAVFPLSSPLVMLARAAERPELWLHVVAILWQALWVGLIVMLSARLFRRTVLKSGPKRRRWWRRAAA